MSEARKDVIRETDAEAIRLAKTLMRTARFGAIAVLEEGAGGPLASRVGVATDADGTPLILVSLLSAHTRALIADARCSLLLGEPGKGDPLAHPRITLVCRGIRLEREMPDHARARRRYLSRNSKAKLYAGLGDFWFFRLEVERASLNGGFGKAYLLTRDDLISAGPVVAALADAEQGALDHMNAEHPDAIDAYARHCCGTAGDGWLLTGIDVDGIDLARGDEARRAFFPAPLSEVSELRGVLVDMARQARAAEQPPG